jgi:hypothetical protein
MHEPKLLLARSLTLLVRESLLKNQGDSSVELVRNVLQDIKIAEHSLSMNDDKALIQSLKTLVLSLCDHSRDDIDILDLIQQIEIITVSDPKLMESLKQSLTVEYNDSSLKKSIVAIRKNLENHFREKQISELFRKASADINFNRDKIANLSNYVQEFMTVLEPLTMDRKSSDPAIMGTLDFGNIEQVREIFQAAREEAAGAGRVYRTLDNGFNEMTQGGLRPQASMSFALQHNYKTGDALTKYSQVLRANTPKTVDKTKIPCQVRISFEDELPNIVNFLFMQMKYSETKEYIDLKKYSTEEMSAYVEENLQKLGWRSIIIRVDPTAWTYKDVFNYITSLEAQGYSVEGLWLDYMALLPTTGCVQGNAGEAVRDMLRRFRNFCAAKGMLFHTPHQVSTEAKALLRGQVTDSQFVKEVAGKGYAAGCRQLDQELDLEYYHHIFKHGGNTYLATQRGKHRLPTNIHDDKKFYIRQFPNNLMPIPDDEPDAPILRRVGASSKTADGDADLTLI